MSEEIKAPQQQQRKIGPLEFSKIVRNKITENLDDVIELGKAAQSADAVNVDFMKQIEEKDREISELKTKLGSALKTIEEQANKL